VTLLVIVHAMNSLDIQLRAVNGASVRAGNAWCVLRQLFTCFRNVEARDLKLDHLLRSRSAEEAVVKLL